MLTVDAKTATAPSVVVNVEWSSPAISSEPTIAIAEIALVSDISGVCSSRDTRRITSRPMNVDSINTNKPVVRSNSTFSGSPIEARGSCARPRRQQGNLHGRPPDHHQADVSGLWSAQIKVPTKGARHRQPKRTRRIVNQPMVP